MKSGGWMGKVVVLGVCVLLAVSFTGCIKQKVLVKLKPDGSGNIVSSVVFSDTFAKAVDETMVEQRKQMLEMGADLPAMEDNNDPLFNEDQIRSSVSNFGENVEYVEARKIQGVAGRGYIAVYSFKNIEDVKFDLRKMSDPTPDFDQRPASDNVITFSLVHDGGVSKLKINISRGEAEEDFEKLLAQEGEIQPTPLSDEEKHGMMEGQGKFLGLTGNEETKEEVIRKMFRDIATDLDIEVVGEVIKSDATFPVKGKKERFSLFAMNFGELFESDRMCSMFVGSMDNGSDEFFNGLLGTKSKIKGLKIEDNPEVNVEFKGK